MPKEQKTGRLRPRAITTVTLLALEDEQLVALRVNAAAPYYRKAGSQSHANYTRDMHAFQWPFVLTRACLQQYCETKHALCMFFASDASILMGSSEGWRRCSTPSRRPPWRAGPHRRGHMSHTRETTRKRPCPRVDRFDLRGDTELISSTDEITGVCRTLALPARGAWPSNWTVALWVSLVPPDEPFHQRGGWQRGGGVGLGETCQKLKCIVRDFGK